MSHNSELMSILYIECISYFIQVTFNQYEAGSYLNIGTTLLSKFNMSVCSLATRIGLLTKGTRKQTTDLPPLLLSTPPHYAISVSSLQFTNIPHTSVFA